MIYWDYKTTCRIMQIYHACKENTDADIRIFYCRRAIQKKQ